MLKCIILLTFVAFVAGQTIGEARIIEDIVLDEYGCGPNQQYYDEGPGCEQNCDNLNVECVQDNIGPSGCYCKDGYIWNQDHTLCISGNRACGCKFNEYFTTNGPICDRTCAYLNQSCEQSGDTAAQDSGLQCYCQDGYSRGDRGNCVPDSVCPCKII